MRPALLAFLLCLFPAGQSAAQQPGASPAAAPQPTVTLPPDLARVLRDYERAWTAKDHATLAGLFAEDGFVLPGGRDMVRGRAAIAEFYKGRGGPLALRAVAFATAGTVGYILGGYSESPGAPDIGKFTLTLKKDSGGRWLIMSDMDNSSRRN